MDNVYSINSGALDYIWGKYLRVYSLSQYWFDPLFKMAEIIANTPRQLLVIKDMYAITFSWITEPASQYSIHTFHKQTNRVIKTTSVLYPIPRKIWILVWFSLFLPPLSLSISHVPSSSLSLSSIPLSCSLSISLALTHTVGINRQLCIMDMLGGLTRRFCVMETCGAWDSGKTRMVGLLESGDNKSKQKEKFTSSYMHS